MKKVIATLVIALATISASAQTYLGGGISFSSTDMEGKDKSLTQFTITPEIGYNLDEKWALGLGVGYSYAKQESNTIMVAPYVRYTVAKAGICSFFIDGEFAFASKKPEDGDSSTGWSLGVKPGVRFDITKKLFATASLGFLGYQDTSDFDGKKTFGFAFSGNGSNSFNDFNSGLKLGLYYNF
ncbi:MAG: outer membrane beta-barrel protein [Prevotella sp.]|nr:outer membrane beta-barrel protein [Prevotella sp.]